jgi:hypothetical protein
VKALINNYKRVTTVDFFSHTHEPDDTQQSAPNSTPNLTLFLSPTIIQYNQNVFLIIDKNTIVMRVQCSVAGAP